MISALFVERGGCYWMVPGVDAWDAARDARKYQGPNPVVAHPPCNLWVNFAALNFQRWGGEHNRPGNDGGCFASALDSVRKWGGVLEHPAGSRAFAAHGIPAPVGVGWQSIGRGEWVCEVWQSAYGHMARKRTWLFLRGVPIPMRWERVAGVCQIGNFDRIKPTLCGKKASATPIAFRDALLSLAMASPLNTKTEAP